MTVEFEDPTPVAPKPEPTINPISIALGEWLRELIWTGASTTPRSKQRAVGMSEVGGVCDRELAYKLNGTRKSNISRDPMASIVGTGIHLVLADFFRRMDAGVGRWLIEEPVSYRGVPGSLDAYDTKKRLLIDWKSTAKAKIRKIRNDGPPQGYIVQANMYAAALRERGEDPQQAAIVYLARDGELADLFVWPVALDPDVADQAVDRRNMLGGLNPELVEAQPSRLCGWCDFYRPNSTDLSVGCPGK